MKKFSVYFPITIIFTAFLIALFFFVNRNEEKNRIKIGDTEITFEQEIDDGETEMQLIVKAPETCVIGEMVTIDATASNCDTFEWLVIPETVDYRTITNGQETLFTSRVPGTYVFIIAGTRDGILLPLKDITIIVEGSAPVPVVVDDTFTITVKSWLPPGADPIILEKLAKSFERVASAGHEEVSDLVKITALSNRGILGSQLELYKPFLIAFSVHLKTNYAEATVDKHIELWFNLANVLRSIK
ncbi:MAG: hypothetical protein V3V68_04935 [Nitrosomonadaceae bacterium]